MALNRDEIGLLFRLQVERKEAEQQISSFRNVLNSQLDSLQQNATARLGTFGDFLGNIGLTATKTITDTAKLADAQRLFESQSNSLFASLANRTKLTLDSTKELLATYRSLPDASARNAFALAQFGDRALALTPALESASQRITKIEQGFDKTSAAAVTTSAGLSGVGIAAGVAGVAIAAIGGALFEAAKSAADFGGDIFDLTQKTSLSAETLSALKVVAEQSGSSLDSVGGAVVRLNKNLGEARSGNEKLQKTFQDLGVDLRGSTQDALAAVVRKFSELPDGVEKTNLAIEVFGKSGADLIPTLNSLEGDLDATIQKMRDLGVTIDDEAAAAADQFGDNVQQLGQQLEGLKVRIGNSVIPALTSLAAVFRDVLKAASESSNGINAFADGIGRAGGSGLGIRLAAAIANQIDPSEDALKEEFERRLDNFNKVLATTQASLKSSSEKTGGGGRRGSGAGGRSTKEADVIGPDARSGASLQQDIERRNRDLLKADQDFLRAIEKSREDFNRREAEIQRINDDAEIARIQDQAQRRIITEEQAQIEIAGLRAKRFAEREDALNRDALGTDITKVQAAQEELKKLSAERAAFEEEAIRKIRDAKDRDLDQERQDIQERIRLYEQLQQKITEIALANPASNISLLGSVGGDVANQTGSLFQGVAATAVDALGQINDSLGNFESIATGAFGNVASGLESMITSFILTGQTGPAAFKRLAAGVIASVAAQSAVKAIFEVAEGFAALARYDPFSASQHFAAAKFYGIVAGVSAAAGIALSASGNTEDQTGRGGAGTRNEQRGTRIIEQGNRERDRIDVFIHAGPEFATSVTRSVVRDYQGNGDVRRLVLGDGQIG